MIAHNGDDFDKIFLKTQLKKLDLQIPSNVYFIDSIFVSKLLYPRIINHHSLLSLGRYFSVIDENAHIHHTPLHPYTLTPLHQYTYTPIHRSLGDVKTLYKLWNIWMSEFYKQYGKNDIITVYNTIYF
jgi:DNA polymerase III epsilon subunit-like protein